MSEEGRSLTHRVYLVHPEALEGLVPVYWVYISIRAEGQLLSICRSTIEIFHCPSWLVWKATRLPSPLIVG